MLIRKAEYSDLDAICRIENLSFDEPWSRASIEAEYYRDIAEIFLAEIDSVTAGYIIIWHIGFESEILVLATDECFRRRGVGSALTAHAISQRKDGGQAIWFLEVAEDNLGALSLYEQFGFTVVGFIENYYGRGKHAFRMVRKQEEAKG